MPTAEARVETDRPERYLAQLCKHFNNKGRHLGHRPRAHHGGDAQALREMQAVAALAQVEWSDTEGVISIPWGQCTMLAAPGVLTLRVEAADEENLRRLQDLVAGHIERFGRRDELRVTWQQVEAPTNLPGKAVSGVPAPERGTGTEKRGWRGRTTVLTAVVALVLAVHLGLGGVLVANWQWTGWAAGGVLAVVLVKVVVLGGFAVQRGRASKSR